MVTKMRKKNQTHQRNTREAYIFITPLIIGTAVFFLFPLCFSIFISLGEYELKQGGNMYTFFGLKNYTYAFLLDKDFTPNFLAVVKDSFLNIPLVVVFSLIIAILLNKKFRGKGFFRTLFFLPFLLGTGYVMRQLLGMDVGQDAMNMARGIILPAEVQQYLGSFISGLADGFLSRITMVFWKSGVPIILFLSGLQSINKSLYESASVDGATEWEMMWKITIPMISQVTLLVTVYTVIESFSDPSNPMVDFFYNLAFKEQRFSYSAALSWIYFVFILLLVGLIFFAARFVTYSERDS